MNTLRQIAKSMDPPIGESTLYVLKGRHDDFPEPRLIAGSINLYDKDEVESWYVARHLILDD